MHPRKSSERICIIVLNWNKPEDTIACLDSLLPSIKQKIASVVLCDNASTDNSIKKILFWAKQHFSNDSSCQSLLAHEDEASDFVLLQIEDNLGYAGGNNIGIQYALSRKIFKYIFILNNDTIVHPNALNALVCHANKHPNIGILGCTVVNYEQPNTLFCAGGCTYQPLTTIFKNVFYNMSLGQALTKEPDIKLDYISGAASFYRTQVFYDFGLLDDDFFLYYEELDFAKRLKGSKFTIGWCPKSIIYHKGAVSTGGKSKNNTKASVISIYHENLSTLIYTRKHHSKILLIAMFLRFFGKFSYYLISRQINLFPIVYRAYKDFFLSRCRFHNKIHFTSKKTNVLFQGSIPKKTYFNSALLQITHKH